MSAVTKPEGFEVFYLTTGKVVHTARRTDTRTLCNKPISGVRLCYTPYVTCTPCLRRLAAQNQGIGERGRMTANDELKTRIEANIERIRDLSQGGASALGDEEAGAREALVNETQALIYQVKGRGSVQLRSDLQGDLFAALKAPEPIVIEGGEVNIVVLEGGDPQVDEDEPEDQDDEEGDGEEGGPLVIPAEVAALIEEASGYVKEAVSLGVQAQSYAEHIAGLQLAMRKATPHKAGIPDLIAFHKYTRDQAGLIYVKAAEAIAPEDVDKEDILKSLKRAVRNKNTDVLVGYLFGLDADKEAGLEDVRRYYPAAATAYLKAKEEETEDEPASLTDAVYALYAGKGIELPRKGRTELERERRRRARELQAGDESRLTPQQRQTNYVETLTMTVGKAEKNLQRLSLSGAQKRKARNDLQKLIDRLSALKEGI